MSARESWTVRRAQRLDREEAMSARAPAPTEPLTAVDRCDRCDAQAYVRALLPSRLELLFCAHHGRQHSAALAKVALEIQDETDRLARTGKTERER